MSITTKDLNLLAEAFRELRPKCPEGDYLLAEQIAEWERFRTVIMSTLVQSNPRFDRERFINATEE